MGVVADGRVRVGGRYAWGVGVRRLQDLSEEEFLGRLRGGDPPTPDDVSIDENGDRLDTREKVLAALARFDARRAEQAAAASRDVAGVEFDD
jgi:hypothetical protein